jgi:hypothetical protein
VVVAVEVEQVALEALVEGALGDALHLQHAPARERQAAVAHEVRGGLAIEHDVADRVNARDPALLAQLAHGVVERLAPELGVLILQRRQLELGGGGHGWEPYGIAAGPIGAAGASG